MADVVKGDHDIRELTPDNPLCLYQDSLMKAASFMFVSGGVKTTQLQR